MTIQSVQSLPQPDGSVAYIVNSSYTVTQSDRPDLWDAVQAWLAAGNKAQPYVPPAPLPPDPVQQAAMDVQAMIPEMLDALIPANAASLSLGTQALIAKWQAARKATGN